MSAGDKQHSTVRAALLDDEGDLSLEFEAALVRIFARFSSSYQKRFPDARASGSNASATLARPDAADVWTEAELDACSTVTNGGALPQESKDEIREFLDTDEEGNLTFSGFCQMYHLQSDNDADETWKDLAQLGFDDSLQYKHQDAQQAESAAPRHEGALASSSQADKQSGEKGDE
ncbi:hypothetical protein L1887_48439 [Cichorium endivia]|nr:hypothetical protein L1887_48439 [Cichorium endivia]